MTREVKVIMEGVTSGVEEDRITVKTEGLYDYRNGKHFIRFEESLEGTNQITNNILKISQHQVHLIKKGAMNTTMIFDLKEDSQITYQTPYGGLVFQVNTKELVVKEYLNEIQVNLNYALFSNGKHLSDNQTRIEIRSK
ncbi:MAG: DUF1934 domain-containing protein [Clostridiales bacterium]|jgi:uncharacterized beta-barrel protein YwiB (DUF1934 family)|nr:DUF1934 domain-containing protein [Clostridiales bacterium]